MGHQVCDQLRVKSVSKLFKRQKLILHKAESLLFSIYYEILRNIEKLIGFFMEDLFLGVPLTNRIMSGNLVIDNLYPLCDYTQSDDSIKANFRYLTHGHTRISGVRSNPRAHAPFVTLRCMAVNPNEALNHFGTGRVSGSRAKRCVPRKWERQATGSRQHTKSRYSAWIFFVLRHSARHNQ